jgi:hypothetical protein
VSLPETPRAEADAAPRRAREIALGVLDGAILAYALLLVAYLVFGGVDLGVVSARRFSKPFLLLFVLVALRLGLPWDSWLVRGLRRFPHLRARDKWTQAALDAAAAFVPTVLAGKAVAFVANLLFPAAGPRNFEMPFVSRKFLETFAAWDSGWYWHIARNGYFYDPAGQSSIAFFPLYPLLMRFVAWPFGGSDRALWLAGIAVSLTSFALALVVLHRLAESVLGGREPARRTVLYVAVFPFAFFFTQVYTEGLFLLLSVSAVTAAMRGRWLWAGLAGGLTALARPNGILILVPLALLACAGRPGLRTLARRGAALLPVPAALGLFCLFVQRLSGDPLGWLHAQQHWGYTLGNNPWVELMRIIDALERLGPYGYFFGDPLAFYYLLHGLVALGFVALVPRVFSRCGLALGAYAAVSLAVPLTGNALEGIGRYAATLFPVFMLLGASRSRRTHETLLIVGSLGLALLTALFVTLHKVY